MFLRSVPERSQSPPIPSREANTRLQPLIERLDQVLKDMKESKKPNALN